MKNLRALLIAATVSIVAACANVPTFGEEGVLAAPRLGAASNETTGVQVPTGSSGFATTSSSPPGDSPEDDGETTRGGHGFGSGS